MVHGIIKQHGGDIQVYSEEGQGTAFKVYLPAVSEEAQENKTVVHPSKTSQGNETILVVEDELSVRTLAARILERFGYNVLEAEEPEAALMLIQKHAEKVHLLVSDVVMPKMDGKTLYTQLREFYPELKVLYMSGYTNEIIAHQGVLEPDIDFIQKPFSMRDFSRKVRKVLDK